nr:MAG TPA: hypothetical protein [Caudoviricetes sp.]
MQSFSYHRTSIPTNRYFPIYQVNSLLINNIVIV